MLKHYQTILVRAALFMLITSFGLMMAFFSAGIDSTAQGNEKTNDKIIALSGNGNAFTIGTYCSYTEDTRKILTIDSVSAPTCNSNEITNPSAQRRHEPGRRRACCQT